MIGDRKDRRPRSRRRGSSGLGIGRIFGVRILLHPSWFVIFALVIITIVASLSNSDDPAAQEISPPLRWLVAVVFAILFFASVLIHELAHALVARRRGLVVNEITLFIFGGAANLEQEAPDARTEALVAAAGPLTSLVLAGLFFGLASAVPVDETTPATVRLAHDFALTLSGANLLLGAFNLIPGFPMDGGRLLRALLWAVTHDFVRATRIATLIGRALAYGLIGLGFVIAINGGSTEAVVNGVWLAFIGWFLNQAAETSYRRVALEKLVEGIAVRDVMDRDVRVVNPNLTLDTLVDQHLLSGEASLYPVTVDDGVLVGTVEIGQVTRVPRADWPNTRVTDIMSRGDAMITMTEPDPLWDVVNRFEESRISAIAIVDADTPRRLLGLVTRDGVFRALRNRAALRA